MSPLAKTLTQTDEELRKMLHIIEAVRNEVRGVILHPGFKDAMQLDVPIMFVLPLMPSDINTEDVPRIHDLLSQVMNGFASRTEAGIASKEKCSGLGIDGSYLNICLTCLAILPDMLVYGSRFCSASSPS